MDIVAMGEALIDFTPLDTENRYQMNFGGAPANLSIVATRMGASCTFIGMVGSDRFGRFIRETLEREGVNVSGLRVTNEAATTLAFVHLAPNGERSFEFVRKPGADMLMRVSELPKECIRNAKILHIGSASLACEPSRSATLEAVKIAHESGVRISFDPNYRESQWERKEDAIREIKAILPYCDLLKVSQEEAQLLTGAKAVFRSSAHLQAAGPRLVLVTCGEKGSFCRYENTTETVKSFTVKAVDTTGAGDTFWGTFLAQMLVNKIAIGITAPEKLLELIRFANAAGAMSVMQKGAISAPLTPGIVQEWLQCKS